ncbi:MiAMP1 family antimicrobial peptide [Streptomyces sp. NPDC057620]|uniref:MiAMP1 family antimicrobial peptide n=1 Tax=Streptomyces sp. NPDC057620 TaxID=3346185 RepID=UPI003680E314
MTGCGLHAIPSNRKGSCKWYHRGQSGRMYNTVDASSPVHTVLPSDLDREQSTSFGWKSIFIVC